MAIDPSLTWPRRRKCGHFFPARKREPGRGCGRYTIMSEITNDNRQDWTDRLGKHLSTVVIVGLAAMFAYGYLAHFVG
jgi:hypothetical protein